MKIASKSLELGNVDVNELVSGMARAYEDSLLSLFKKLNVGVAGKIYSKLKGKKVKAIEPAKEKAHKLSSYEVFIDTLKQMGRPAMTKEIAARIKFVHPEVKFPKDKKVLMQQIYNSASYLSKEGLIVRTPVGKRLFEYSLKPVSKNTHETNEK